MADIDLSKYGITGAKEIVHNPSYEYLFDEEMKSELTGYDKGTGCGQRHDGRVYGPFAEG